MTSKRWIRSAISIGLSVPIPGWAQVHLTSRVVEGAVLVSGVATPSAKVRILDAGGVALPLQTGDSVPADATSGVFTAVMIVPLYGGQTIQIEQQLVTGSRVTDPPILVPGLADWGRIRANFTAGIVLSSNTGFQIPAADSRSTLFLGMNIEKNWKWVGPTSRVGLSSYFDVRLTSAPVAAAVTDAVSKLLTSVKSAELQGGAYLPVLASGWNWQNVPNALFIAPIAKVGFITPTTVIEQMNPTPFYNFYAFGVRMGHFKLSANRDFAPELMSYLDVVIGRFGNLETLGTYVDRRWRIEVEGVMKVPASPFLLGFDANIGQNLGTATTVRAAKDDLRFFIGAKFDIGKLVAKLQQF